MGQVEADRPYRRNPAHADTDPGLEVRQFECIEGVALIDEGRDPPLFSDGILVLDAAGDHVAATDAVTFVVFRGQALIVVAAHALVATGEETQRWRY
ncbi:hypothetical protein D3C71_1011870 [compost metagenome]